MQVWWEWGVKEVCSISNGYQTTHLDIVARVALLWSCARGVVAKEW